MTVISFEDAKKNINFLTSSFNLMKKDSKTTAELLTEAFKALDKLKS